MTTEQDDSLALDTDDDGDDDDLEAERYIQGQIDVSLPGCQKIIALLPWHKLNGVLQQGKMPWDAFNRWVCHPEYCPIGYEECDDRNLKRCAFYAVFREELSRRAI